ncbi:MAG TPA: peptide ABC transporter ATP-binding protein [Firmicutes bacterium]|nr:peptide ABC transporter ATP-binding protein [Bacillota bacterium]
MAPLLSVKNLHTYFYRPDGVVKAVDGISYDLEVGETLGIVGESGSGKSVSVLSMLRLIRKNGRIEEGEAVFDGQDLLTLDKEELRTIRGKEISMIFQDPMTSLNPTFRIGRQMMEPPLWHNLLGSQEARQKALHLLERVGIPEHKSRFFDYPFQFSGGMRQRAMIAMALICEPRLIIADEPTTALDVTVRSQILNLLQEMKEALGMSIIMITHDFSMASNFCDQIIVMYAGKIMEKASTMEFLSNCLHPYSQGLIRSTLDLDTMDVKLNPIPGSPPNPIYPPSGCRFHPRCERRQPICAEEIPALREGGADHWVSCHFAGGGVKK